MNTDAVDYSNVVELVAQLSSNDNSIRADAEKRYELLKTNNVVSVQIPTMMVNILVDESVAPEKSLLAAVLLRRLLLETEIYRKMSPTV